MSESSTHTLSPGSRLSEYEILSVLGEGGFAITYLARDINLDIEVALKEYFPGGLATRDATQRVVPYSGSRLEGYQVGLKTFIKEARLLARISHPNIVQVRRYFEDKGTAYLVMEYIKGQTLHSKLDQIGALTEEEMKAVMMPIIDGLEYVHKMGVLHRDIKSDNILITDLGKPVLIDFGAAKQETGEKTKAQSTFQTVADGYSPLEQYSTAGTVGPWSDIYALSATAYYCLTLKRLSSATDRVLNDDYVPLAKAVSKPESFSPQLLQAIDRGLSLKPEQRPQSISDFVSELNATSSKPAEPMQSSPEPVKKQPEPKVQRPRHDEKAGTGGDDLGGQPPVKPAKSHGVFWSIFAGIAILFAVGIGSLFYDKKISSEAGFEQAILANSPDDEEQFLVFDFETLEVYGSDGTELKIEDLERDKGFDTFTISKGDDFVVIQYDRATKALDWYVDGEESEDDKPTYTGIARKIEVLDTYGAALVMDGYWSMGSENPGKGCKNYYYEIIDSKTARYYNNDKGKVISSDFDWRDENGFIKESQSDSDDYVLFRAYWDPQDESAFVAIDYSKSFADGGDGENLYDANERVLSKDSRCDNHDDIVFFDVVARGDAKKGKEKAVVCAACHGANGISSIELYPSLAGAFQSWTSHRLMAYRNGQIEDPVMGPMAKNLSDEDIYDISAYYASLNEDGSSGSGE